MLAKRWLYGLLGALMLLLLPPLAVTSYAHAVLVRSEPAANATLAESPKEVRLWFAEQLEPDYSKIELRDDKGALVATAPSHLDPTDSSQMVLETGKLPAGLYTVVWRNVSAADGHGVSGAFPFIIGAAQATTPKASVAMDALPRFDLISRWFNLVGVALAVGSIAFVVFVWRPATRGLTPKVPGPLWIVVWSGWVAAGIGAVLLLVNQATILLDQPVSAVLSWNALWHIITTTRFGSLWLERMGLWLVMGALLLAARRSTLFEWLATACGLLMLLPISMFSHAATGSDARISIFSDWVHLAMMALWVGGLMQFCVAIPVQRRLVQHLAPKLGLLVVSFSNYARIAVIALIVTGIYATWNQVTTWEALISTLYGQLLLLKLALAVVLLGVAGINLLWTQRRLLAGHEVWVGRLRGLVAAEVCLAFAILLVVGAMTAISPARDVIMQRMTAAAVPPAPAPQPIHVMTTADDLSIGVTISPGWVGSNTFTVHLTDDKGNPVTNASLIRLRFDNISPAIASSELQIRPQGESKDGAYSIEGANLSVDGNWQLRMTIKRPQQYDSVADTEFKVIPMPPPPPMPPAMEENPVLPYRTPVLLGAGILAVLAGLYSLVEQRRHLWQGSSLLASLLVILGAAFLLTGFLT